MKTVLVILVYTFQAWHPQYVLKYPTETQCQSEMIKINAQKDVSQRAECVPEVKFQ